MESKRKFELDVPDGLQIYESYIEVAGAHQRRADVIDFMKGKTLTLELEREPRNQYDKNAIKVIGVAKGLFLSKRYHLGYVPADMARRLVVGRFLPIGGTLRMIQVGEYVNLKFDLLGPDGRKKEYGEFKVK